jgi:hypothetical protein
MAAPERAAPQRQATPPRVTPQPRAAGRPAPEGRPRAVEQRQQRIEQRALQRQERIQQRDAQRPSVQTPQTRAAERLQERQFRTQERQQIRQMQVKERQEIRQLQAKQRQEFRGKNLSRAERRDLQVRQRGELQNLRAQQREQRDQRRQALQTQRQQALGQDQNLRDQRRLDRGDRAARIETARQGRFAARYQNRADRREARLERVAARHAWRKGKRAAFVAWLGPVFYPYAYSDIFEYTYWPYAYDEAYWAYVYDDFFDGVFWGYGNPYIDGYYATAALPDTTGSAPPSPRRALPRGTAQSTAQLCRDPGQGVTAWPFTQIEQAVRPNEDQRRLLDDLKRAAADAAAAFKASCDEDIALTPPGRLAAMTRRVEATLRAVRIVRPALDAFYNSLSDEQKARFTAVGPDELGVDQRRRATREQAPLDAKACDAKGLVELPMQEVEDAVQPTSAQREKFDRLSLAASSAVDLLQAACPDAIALTPSGRLEAMEKRLDALVQAAKTVQPALSDFYASLSNEQKAQFNALGRQAQRVN